MFLYMEIMVLEFVVIIIVCVRGFVWILEGCELIVGGGLVLFLGI